MKLTVKIFTILTILICVFSFNFNISAATPYQSYLYASETDEIVVAPAAAVPQKIISGFDFGVGAFVEPSDLFQSEDGAIFLLDSGNARIVCIDENLQTIKYILKSTDTFNFSGAQGLFVSKDSIYVADTNNARILKYNRPNDQKSADYISDNAIVIAPKGVMFESETVFNPIKLVVDDMNRLFVVAKGVYNGLMEFSEDGSFLAYVGANKIKLSLGEQLWKMFATRAQWDASAKTVPVEFSNITIDSEGFMFTTSRSNYDDSLMIRRLNLSGKDVLLSDDDTKLGDIALKPEEKATYFVDVAIGDDNVFAGLDQTRGRIFVYNEECQLLFQFGAIGTQVGCFQSPAALLWLPDGRFCVLDSLTGEMSVFTMTEYGNLILDCIHFETEGNYDKAKNCYKQVLSINANNEYAYSGIGKQYYREGDYKNALKYLKLGNQREYYSKAFIKYRKQILDKIIPVVVVVIAAIVVLTITISLIKGIKKAREQIREIRVLSKKIIERKQKNENF